MSAFIGSVKGPHHNSPNSAAEVWCSPHQVELTVFENNVWKRVVPTDTDSPAVEGVSRTLDPVAARNLAALLIRASQEAEWVAATEVRIDGED